MTKSLMEYMFLQYEREIKGTAYRMVRYGNVLASTGSVLNVWKRAKELGDPLLLTDPEMTRFFFTVEEAVQTIYDCLDNSSDATPYIPKMRSIRMGDLAEVIADGHEIKIVGRRAGEKGDEAMSEEYSSETADRMTQGEIRQELKKINML